MIYKVLLIVSWLSIGAAMLTWRPVLSSESVLYQVTAIVPLNAITPATGLDMQPAAQQIVLYSNEILKAE